MQLFRYYIIIRFHYPLGETMNHELNPHEPVNVHGITLGDSYWKFAVELGRGNASRGIREALYRASLSNSNKAVCENDSDRVGESIIL